MKPNQCIKKIGDYALQKVIGKGSFATVYLAVHTKTNQTYAIKEMEIPVIDDGREELFQREIEILKKVDHKCIIKMHDMIPRDQYLYLVFDYCRNGDLEKFLKQNQQTSRLGIPEQKARSIFVQVVTALLELKRLNIVHRDLKLANILVTEDHEVKLADFGFAKFMGQDSLLESYCGTPLTMAPEILKNDQYTSKCDIWSLGVILYQMVFGTAPFKPRAGGNVNDLLAVIETQQLKFPPYIEASQQLKSILEQMLVRDAKIRLSIEQVTQHPWVKDAFQNAKQQSQQSQSYLQKMASNQEQVMILESMDVFHDAQEQAFDNELTQEVGNSILQLQQDLRKFITNMKNDMKGLTTPAIDNKFNTIIGNSFKLKLTFPSAQTQTNAQFVHLQGEEIQLDVYLSDLIKDLYTLFLTRKELKILNCIKNFILYINNQQGLVSSEIKCQGFQSSALNIFLIQQMIQNNMPLKENQSISPKISQVFRSSDDDWALVQEVIMDRSRLFEMIY